LQDASIVVIGHSTKSIVQYVPRLLEVTNNANIRLVQSMPQVIQQRDAA